MQRIRELDGLRTFAIFGVFLTHLRPINRPAFDLLNAGWAGVDLFFGISGFLITSILIGMRGQVAPYKTFYWRRFLRIFPPYYLAVALLLLLVFLHKEQVLTHQGIASFLFLSSVKPHAISLVFQRLFSHNGFDFAIQPIVNGDYFNQFNAGFGVFWSLSVEEIFYLLWAPVILMGSRRTVLFWSITPLLICPILRALAHASTNFSEGFGFLFRFDAIAGGGCIALLFLAIKNGEIDRRLAGHWLIGAGVISLLALGILGWRCGLFRGMELRSAFSFSVFGYSLLGLLCASAVGICVNWAGQTSTPFRLLRSAPLVYLGTISYVMYLIHIPVNVAVHLAFLRLGGWVAGADTLHAAIAILCTITLAGLSWKFFETPILKLKDRQFGARTGRAIQSQVADTSQ